MYNKQDMDTFSGWRKNGHRLQRIFQVSVVFQGNLFKLAKKMAT